MGWLFLPVLFQTQASVGVGVGTVRYAGGSNLAVASVSPTLQLVSPSLESNVSGTLAALPHSAWFAQGRADLWGATAPLDDEWRLGGEGIWTGTTRSDNGRTAALHGVAEVLWARPDWGVGLGAGPSAGWISDTSGGWVTALHTRARAWWSAGGASWAASLEPTHFLGAWFTDLEASATVDHGRVSATAWSVLRVSHVYGSSAAASALVRFSASPSVALEVGGGSFLRDPYQGFPRAGFITAAIRLVRATRAASKGGAGGGGTAEPVWPPLIPQVHGDTVTVRFSMPGASSVMIAGDWNSWAPVPLRALGGDLWAGALTLRPGTYHFNLLVDGKEWVVPRGVATVPDGLGGIVGVLIVN